MVSWSVPRPMLRSLINVSDVRSSSFIVVILSIPRTSGSSPCPASCTLARLVRICVLPEPTMTLRANIGSIVMGIMFVYQAVIPAGITWSGLPYYSISLSLNVLLTLMIVVRLIVHARNARTALGTTGIGGLYKAVITMLVESCAIFTVSSLLVIGPWGAGISPIVNLFMPILYQTQVRAIPRLPYSDGSADVTMDWTGHRPTACHPASRQ